MRYILAQLITPFLIVGGILWGLLLLLYGPAHAEPQGSISTSMNKLKMILNARISEVGEPEIPADFDFFTIVAEQDSSSLGWLQINNDGFGSASNIAVTSLSSFSGQLYAGTHNVSGNGAQLWRLGSTGWSPLMTDGFGNGNNKSVEHLIEFKGKLYASNWNDDDGGEVWRSSNGENWSQVVSAGFGEPANGDIYFAVFSDTLYASTWFNSKGTEIWRSSTGDNGDWIRVVSNGFGDPNNSGIFNFEEYNGYLYAGTANAANGGEIWRSNNGNTWVQVNPEGFGDVGNSAVVSLTAFKDNLYASTRRHTAGAGIQIWRCQVCDNSDWMQVVDNGFGNADTRLAPVLEVFNGYLYTVVGNPITGIEVWRTADGKNWEQVGSKGFGDSNNTFSAWDNSVTVFDNNLYVGTANMVTGGEVWLYLPNKVYLPLLIL